MLLIFGLQATYFASTMTEPDMKFGASAPYLLLVLLGGFGGFIAALSALAVTFVFEEVRKTTLNPSRIAAVAGIASLPIAAMAWYATTQSSLSVFGTVAALFVTGTLLFVTLLYAAERWRSNA
jgi:ABC-type branched-subunit amino acid transport system permease subunit